QCSFTVMVNDNQPPTLTACPSDITQSTDPGVCSAVVTFTAPTASDLCDGTVPVTCTPASGSTFNKGTTTVTCTATDAANNSASCHFDVTVNDTENPAAHCPANIMVTTDATACSAVVSYTATASDNCPGSTIACCPASG